MHLSKATYSTYLKRIAHSDYRLVPFYPEIYGTKCLVALDSFGESQMNNSRDWFVEKERDLQSYEPLDCSLLPV